MRRPYALALIVALLFGCSAMESAMTARHQGEAGRIERARAARYHQPRHQVMQAVHIAIARR